MAFSMIVRLPVSVPYGTDEEFDLRVRLERELGAALRLARAGEPAGGEIDTSHLNLTLDAIPDPAMALVAVKEVLARNGLLGRAIVVLETRTADDPDDCDRQVLWPAAPAGVARSA
jgi:hypothetical protein